MTVEQVAKKYGGKLASEKVLEDKIEELEKIIENLCDRVDYLEKHI